MQGNKNAFQSKATFRLPIESQTLKIWPWNDLDLGMTLTSDKLSQVKLMSRCQISIFHEMTLTLTQQPWYDLDLIYDLQLRYVKLS